MSTPLVDIRQIKIDKTLPPKERLAMYKSQIQDPQHFKCGKLTITLGYLPTEETLKDKLASYLNSL